jgi:phosphatidylglycerophosphate synthase
MTDRRPIPVRSTSWAKRAAKTLTDAGVRPNQISVASVVIAGAGAACLIISRSADDQIRIALLLIAALTIPLRLLCNMLDGMVAVEFGKASRTGDVYNELPDRIADALLLVGAGYAVTDPEWVTALGWAAALLAVITAYIRTLGAASGVRQDYSGPMAKQQRMALLAAACVAGAVEVAAGGEDYALTVALVVIALGSGLTALLRTRRLLLALERGA